MTSYFSNLSQRIATALKSAGPVAVKSQIPPPKFNVNLKTTAEDLIHTFKPIEITSNKVGCDGGNGPLGHPMVYINLDNHEPQACGYCGVRFVKKDGHHHH
ncbi:hypothetical protein SAMD00019534_099140 [Acytostelium subglobosum LB1]|uniref:hypothetical protein n=1 Tax=Acytostelium subglobosum LB1 TaxID=1410327 RepID=UPI0006451016|nr:hypothetical protein SAMD00019534_099140 [Acytostelium subglobosum LB1]GAM26739.1 hypothetical protein SAMD00019534_099140 [Acytostelium subglobosum LB1]|eukprot:XP_012750400.1 hypothetical protein SAMD00019534_099140 [Acytostelium subglobosum LB1]